MDLTHLKDQATEESGANNFFGKYHYEINKKSLKYMLDTITGTP